MLRLAAPLLLLLCLALPVATPAAAGPFDDLSEADRAALDIEIRRYLLEHPEVMLEVIDLLEKRQQEAAAAAETMALEQHRDQIFADGYSHIAGNPEGDITIVEFLDYQCSFCKRAHPEVAELLASDGNIRLIQKEFPILGPVSEAASRAAAAVLINDGPETYATFSDLLMSHEGQLSEGVILSLARRSGADIDAMTTAARGEEVSGIIAANRALGQALGISGTPTFIVVDEFVRGYMPLAQMRHLVADKRSEM